MELREFNAAPTPAVTAALRSCADVSRWVAEIAAGRPYADVDALLERARTAADPWTTAEVDAALARHPRIGERAQGPGADAAMSRQEQAGVADAAADVTERLAAGNRAYEERFGHVFLIRAAGRSPEEILAQLEERLLRTPEEERVTAAGNLREIALLRLQGMVTP